jgi:hypothetical protein
MTRILLLAALLWLGGCAAYVATSGGVAIQQESAAAIPVADRNAIREYFRTAGIPARALPFGVALQKPLPGGVATQLLPAALERRLSPLPDGCRRVRLGRDVLLIETRSGVVLDIASGG